ncbi:hydrolase [Serinicoccus sp. CNJ-927]|uniref:HAD-IIA family hydrolase n=1 Tax=Serinicoccus sp. CNJ-927 TaxID=1904970 RepID=UPI000966E729|nr:HAD-IIA family hydrolase [Serinicoccus sp. CNJ-927]OLT44178.1 hydrolase [Serinicoccus sp. CNJ-927]
MIEGMLCDLDGVVYRAHEPCEGAVEALADARAAGARVLYMTNNASRTPQQVAAQLRDLGVTAEDEDVMTASQVAAEVLRERRPELLEGGCVLAVGGPGVADALGAVGFETLAPQDVAHVAGSGRAPEIGAVVQGYGPQVGVIDLAEAAYAIRAGAEWIATNDDATLPTERGEAPGNGSLIAAVAHATGAAPLVVGKPHAPAYRTALSRLGTSPAATLMVGDRLETDIGGAVAAGLQSALVLTGVSTRDDAEAAPPACRPDRVAATMMDLTDLWRTS